MDDGLTGSDGSLAGGEGAWRSNVGKRQCVRSDSPC